LKAASDPAISSNIGLIVEIPPSETSPQRASILHNHNGKDLREIQELLRNIGPIVRYTQLGCELTRQTAEALVEL